jgi:hypothetical protein
MTNQILHLCHHTRTSKPWSISFAMPLCYKQEKKNEQELRDEDMREGRADRKKEKRNKKADRRRERKRNQKIKRKEAALMSCPCHLQITTAQPPYSPALAIYVPTPASLPSPHHRIAAALPLPQALT